MFDLMRSMIDFGIGHAIDTQEIQYIETLKEYVFVLYLFRTCFCSIIYV